MQAAILVAVHSSMQNIELSRDLGRALRPVMFFVFIRLRDVGHVLRDVDHVSP